MPRTAAFTAGYECQIIIPFHVRSPLLHRSAKGVNARRQTARETVKHLGGALDLAPVLRGFLEVNAQASSSAAAGPSLNSISRSHSCNFRSIASSQPRSAIVANS